MGFSSESGNLAKSKNILIGYLNISNFCNIIVFKTISLFDQFSIFHFMSPSFLECLGSPKSTKVITAESKFAYETFLIHIFHFIFIHWHFPVFLLERKVCEPRKSRI